MTATTNLDIAALADAIEAALAGTKARVSRHTSRARIAQVTAYVPGDGWELTVWDDGELHAVGTPDAGFWAVIAVVREAVGEGGEP